MTKGVAPRLAPPRDRPGASESPGVPGAALLRSVPPQATLLQVQPHPRIRPSCRDGENRPSSSSFQVRAERPPRWGGDTSQMPVYDIRIDLASPIGRVQRPIDAKSSMRAAVESGEPRQPAQGRITCIRPVKPRPRMTELCTRRFMPPFVPPRFFRLPAHVPIKGPNDLKCNNP